MFKRCRIFIYTFIIRSVGRLSTGIRICLESGLTSGRMLDYIYENKPSGRLGIGKIIDKIYLRHPDWQAIRIRKDSVSGYITETILNNRKENSPTAILDIAAGFARYILEALEKVGQENTEVICLDTNQQYPKEVKERFQKRGFHIRYENKSAFDNDFIKSLVSPNLVISSGFYDWIVDDKPVEDSIKIVYEILRPGGCFVLTGQGKHPDLELTTKAFIDFKKEPLKMKMRQPEVIKSLLEKAGFKNIKHTTDKWGYYYTIKGEK
ncbi:MAG: class I SAM-dependent methyltransferase family protein [Candidatus Omnitrophica bacterium]|nr:class I SAM-dependent methyltransferase family protein [Candidatus Omnitrophota bacterium]